MKTKMIVNLIVLLTLIQISSCNSYETQLELYLRTKAPSPLPDFESFEKSWNEKDTCAVIKYISILDTVRDKNDFYAGVSDFQAKAGPVVLSFAEECQNEKYLGFYDLIIDSPIEELNKNNVMLGLKYYCKSKLFLKCNYEYDSISAIKHKYWKRCEVMSDLDFEVLVKEYDRYALTLPLKDSCFVIP